MTDSARTPSRYNFQQSKTRHFIHPSAKVEIDPSATVTLGNIVVSEGASLKIGPNSDLQELDLWLAPGARLEIGERCSSLRNNLRVRNEGASLEIGNYCALNRNSLIVSDDSIRLGNYVLVAMNVLIADTPVHSLNSQQRAEAIHNWRHGKKNERALETTPIIIGDRCWICYGAAIPGAKRGKDALTLGQGVVVAANAVVKDSFEGYQIVGGVPAKHLKFLEGSDRLYKGETDETINPMNH